MEGYINNEAATAACFDDDGWFYTGDVGHYDEYGNLKVVERIKELIKVNALQVCNNVNLFSQSIKILKVTSETVIFISYKMTVYYRSRLVKLRMLY